MTPSADDAPIRVRVEGLEDRQQLQELLTFIKRQAEVQRLVARIVVPRTGPGIAIELRMPVPEVVELSWRGYQIRATGFEGELYIVCRKHT